MKLFFVVASLLAVAIAQNPNNPSIGDTLLQGRCFGWNQSMFSERRCMRVDVQRDGNMVVYRHANNAPVWATNTVGRGGYQACLQGDGNFVLQNPTGGGTWATNTVNRGRRVFIFESGNFVVFDQSNAIIWQSARTSPC